jgi:hypothetical protein
MGRTVNVYKMFCEILMPKVLDPDGKIILDNIVKKQGPRGSVVD